MFLYIVVEESHKVAKKYENLFDSICIYLFIFINTKRKKCLQDRLAFIFYVLNSGNGH